MSDDYYLQHYCMEQWYAQQYVDCYGEPDCPCCLSSGVHFTRPGNDPDALEFPCYSCSGSGRLEVKPNDD